MDVGRVALAYLGLVSALALLLTVIDKARARRAGQRIPERALLGVALVGGSPGLLLGMLLARHKTRKPSFLLSLALVIALQLAALWLWVRT